MKLRLRVSPKAEVDLDAYGIYFSLEAGDDVATRFRDNARKSMESPLEFPNRGAERAFGRPLLWSLRMWPIEGFPRTYLFYQVTTEFVDIVRVLSPERDLGIESFE